MKNSKQPFSSPTILKDFRNKKVFITGHTGFKGSWLSLWLMVLGAKVKGYSLPPKKKSLYNQLKIQSKIESVYSDIRNYEKLKAEIIKFQPDFIFHLAAQPLVRESYQTPLETFETNILGTAHLLESLKFLKKKCVMVIITTDKVYENLEIDYAYKESDKLGGYDPYSASKAAAEIVIESYRSSFFNPEKFELHKKGIASARAGNVIGGGDYAKDRIFPDIFRALSKSKTIEIRNPKAIRPWQHVLEPLWGYLVLGIRLFENPQNFSTSFNFGPAPEDVIPVETFCKKAISYWGKGDYKIIDQKNPLHEAGLLKLNNQKARMLLGWKPKWNSHTAIEKTIYWYKKSLKRNPDFVAICTEEINEYLKGNNF